MKRNTLMALFACLVLAACSTQARADSCNGFSTTNLVQNCAFGTGTFANWSGTSTTDGSAFVDQGDPLALGVTPYKGLPNEVALGSQTDDTLTQVLTTVPGYGYEIEFALLNDTSAGVGYPNDFSVSFGGTKLFSESNVPADPYTLYTLYSPAVTSTSTALTFTSANALGDFELDSVSVSPAPEPGGLVLLGTGLAGVLAQVRRRSTK